MENKREREKIQTEREFSEMKKESKVAKEEKDKIEKEYTGPFSKYAHILSPSATKNHVSRMLKM